MRRLLGWVVVLAACLGGPGCGNEPRATPTRIPVHLRLPRPSPDMGPGGGLPLPPGQAPGGKKQEVPPDGE
jgi:hypothetical protein